MILRQRLGGEEIERSRLVVAHQHVEHGQLVGKGLAAGGGSNHNERFAALGVLDCLGLVGIEVGDAALAQPLAQQWMQRIGDRFKVCSLRRQRTPCGNVLHKGGVPAQVSEKFR